MLSVVMGESSSVEEPFLLRAAAGRNTERTLSESKRRGFFAATRVIQTTRVHQFDESDRPTDEAIHRNDTSDRPTDETIHRNDKSDRPTDETIHRNDTSDRPTDESIHRNDKSECRAGGTECRKLTSDRLRRGPIRKKLESECPSDDPIRSKDEIDRSRRPTPEQVPTHLEGLSAARPRRSVDVMTRSRTTALLLASLAAAAGIFIACGGDDSTSASSDAGSGDASNGTDGTTAAGDTGGSTDAGASQDTGAATDAGGDTGSLPDACTESTCITQVAAGYLFACGIVSDGTVLCWGANGEAELGRDTLDASSSAQPAPVTGITDAVQVVAGFYHACALRSNGHVSCWGWNANGQLGPNGTDGGTPANAAPVDVPGIPGTVAAIRAGGFFTCAHLADKRVFCWGEDQYGQLGGGTLNVGGTYDPGIQPTPVEVTTLGMVQELCSGDRYNCARTAAGGIECLGRNVEGQLGRGDASFTGNDDTAAPVVAITNATRLFESEAYHACALANGNVLCWGENSSGQCGADPAEAGTHLHTPNVVGGLGTIADLSAGGTSTCALTQTGTVKCWGGNNQGQLARNPDSGFVAPVPADVPGVANVVQVAAGHETTCALLKGGAVWCWGNDSAGGLGRPDASAGAPPWTPAPVQF
jgi:alpha-tubulin suppressor-like RCC1 family protein